jgi:pyruvate dehydrogenase E1 component alpha subunit/2-oxoisovalerate dehydrogenase E1 component alpha subunit
MTRRNGQKPKAQAKRGKNANHRGANKKPAPAKAAAPAAPAQPKAPAPAPPSGEAAMVSVLRDDGSAAREPGIDADKLVYLYRTMVQVREFDRRMLMLQRQGRIGFYGPILGQEAATVGSVAAVEERDWIFPALREGAAAIMRGLPLHLAVAQLIGNELDLCRGRQMPCHYTWRRGNYVAMSSVVGTQISHAVGAAMAARIRGDDTVVLGYLGDGATSTNDFHAGMNFAAVHRAPVVLFCQNNQWAISVPVSQQHASETIAIKGKAYGMRSVRVDGNDVLAVHAVTAEAAARARAGEGPTFIEAVTYRRLGHSSSDDPSRYRDPREVEVWERRDPVERFRRFLQQRQLWSDERERVLQEEIAAEVNAAIREAEQSPPAPPDDSLIRDVYAETPPHLLAELAELEELGAHDEHRH